jgi:hypothetical protein
MIVWQRLGRSELQGFLNDYLESCENSRTDRAIIRIGQYTRLPLSCVHGMIVKRELAMPLESKRFPALIKKLYGLVAELETMFPGRPFTPDGHMVGSLAECFAEYYYGLDLYRCSYPGHDAHTKDCEVEIKATQGNSVSLRSAPDKLLVFRLLRNGSFEEIYNGPGDPVWALVGSKARPSNGQYQVRLTQLKRLMQSVPVEQRLPRVRE